MPSTAPWMNKVMKFVEGGRAKYIKPLRDWKSSGPGADVAEQKPSKRVPTEKKRDQNGVTVV